MLFFLLLSIYLFINHPGILFDKACFISHCDFFEHIFFLPYLCFEFLNNFSL